VEVDLCKYLYIHVVHSYGSYGMSILMFSQGETCLSFQQNSMFDIEDILNQVEADLQIKFVKINIF